MRDEYIKSRKFNRRAVILGGVQLFAFSTILSRLYFLQVAQGDKYKTLSDGNRVRLFPVLPKRGRIFDRYGSLLADGSVHYKLLFDILPNKKKPYEEIEQLINEVADLIKLDHSKKQAVLEKISAIMSNKTSAATQIEITDYLTWQQMATIEVNTHALPGILITAPEIRNYPYSPITSHLIGYIGILSKKEYVFILVHPVILCAIFCTSSKISLPIGAATLEP